MLNPVPPILPIPSGGQDHGPSFAGRSVDISEGAVRNAREVRAPDDVLKALEHALNQLLPNTLPPQTQLVIEVDPETRHFVYKSVDASSGKLVRQWPSQQILDMIKTLRNLSGITVDGDA